MKKDYYLFRDTDVDANRSLFDDLSALLPEGSVRRIGDMPLCLIESPAEDPRPEMLEFSRTCPPLIVLRGAREDQIPQFLLVELCKKEGLTVSTAESCTAGLVSSKIADVPGASSVLCGGAVTYMSRIKHEWLGVSDKTIRSPGVYSELCAREMAEGVAEKSGSDLAVSVTGLAGPGGGTPEIPVGTVCFGYRIGKNTETETVHFPPDSSRETIRRESASHALLSLFKRILLRMEPETFFE